MSLRPPQRQIQAKGERECILATSFIGIRAVTVMSWNPGVGVPVVAPPWLGWGSHSGLVPWDLRRHGDHPVSAAPDAAGESRINRGPRASIAASVLVEHLQPSVSGSSSRVKHAASRGEDHDSWSLAARNFSAFRLRSGILATGDGPRESRPMPRSRIRVTIS